MKNFDVIVMDLYTELLKKEVVETIPRKDEDIGKLLDIRATTITTYRHRNSIPFERIINVSLKYGLDMNQVFKSLQKKEENE